MADALRAAVVQRLVDGIGPVPLAGVAGAAEAVAGGVLERGAVLPRGMSPLGACEIEAHDPRVLVVHCDPRQLERHRGRERADTAHHQAGLRSGLRRGPPEPAQRGLDRLRERERRAVQRRRVAHLNIAHVLSRGVDDELVRDPLERLGGLHHRQSDLVLGQVFLEAARALDRQRARERLRRVRRQPDALRARQVEHRLRPEAPIEVHVQLGLGPAPQQVLGEARGTLPGGHHHAEDGAPLTHGIARVHRAPHAVRGVRGAAHEQAGELAVEHLHRVAHRRAARHAHRLLVDEDAQLARAHSARKIAKPTLNALPSSPSRG